MSEPSVNKNNKAVSKLERIKMYDGILHTGMAQAWHQKKINSESWLSLEKK